MSDLLELFSRDPLTYTKEGKEVETIIAKLRSQREAFTLGNLRAGNNKPKAAPKPVETLGVKLDLSHLLKKKV